MADVQWIKIKTDMFDNRKIKYLRKLPEGNSIVLIWVMLLTMAGRCNASGMVFLTENIPYTPKMLADELEFEENTVVLALEALERMNMIVRDNGTFYIPGWEEHQNAEALDKIKEQNNIRKRRQRERQKLLTSHGNVTEMSRDTSVTKDGHARDCHATEEDKEIDKEEDKDKRIVGYKSIIDMYNDICVSFPRVTKLSDARKKAIKARLHCYNIEDFKTLFRKAEASSFLKGINNRNWSANFDWLIKDSNMAKVLDGNYDEKQGTKTTVSNTIQKKDDREYCIYEGDDPLKDLFD